MLKNLGGTEIVILGSILPSFFKGKKLRELLRGRAKSKEESKKAKSSENKGPKDENDKGGGD